MKDRKVIQIAAQPFGLYALCDDNTIWGLIRSKDNDHPEWKQLPPIPNQTEDE